MLQVYVALLLHVAFSLQQLELGLYVHPQLCVVLLPYGALHSIFYQLQPVVATSADLASFVQPAFPPPSAFVWLFHLQPILAEYCRNFAAHLHELHLRLHILQPLCVQHRLLPAVVELKIRLRVLLALQPLFHGHDVALPVNAFRFQHRRLNLAVVPCHYQVLHFVAERVQPVRSA